MDKSTDNVLQSWEKKLFADVMLMKVLESLTKSPKSIKIISEETGIPVPTVYKKMRKLKEKNLISRTGKIIESGGKGFLYSIL